MGVYWKEAIAALSQCSLVPLFPPPPRPHLSLFPFKNWKKGPQAKKHEQFQETGKGKDTDSLMESPERT